MTHDELISALEKATGPDRELDKAITEYLYLGEPLQWPDQYLADTEHWSKRAVRQYTSSLDAALTLMPPEANCWGIEKMKNHYEAYVSRNYVKDGHWYKDGEHLNPAIALCIAALRARGARI